MKTSQRRVILSCDKFIGHVNVTMAVIQRSQVISGHQIET